MRILAFDVGMKTVGIAVSDELGIAAHGVDTYRRTGLQQDAKSLAGLLSKHGCDKIVVGLPLELSGVAGHRVKRVRKLMSAVQAHCEDLGQAVEIIEWDERFSTSAAERALLEGGVRRAKRKQIIDKQAAVVILQSWLDAHSGERSGSAG